MCRPNLKNLTGKNFLYFNSVFSEQNGLQCPSLFKIGAAYYCLSVTRHAFSNAIWHKILVDTNKTSLQWKNYLLESFTLQFWILAFWHFGILAFWHFGILTF
jgi:hypothetical protein